MIRRPGKAIQRFETALYAGDVIPESDENIPAHFDEKALIIDKQYPLGPCWNFVVNGRIRIDMACGFRQINGKCRTLILDAFDLNPAAMIVDDSQGNGQPQTGAFALFLCREIRVENPFEIDRIDAMSGITHLQPHIHAGRQIPVAADDGFAAFTPVQGDGEHAGRPAHGVKSVGAEVHDQLVKLGCIGSHRGQIRGDVGMDLDIGRQGRLHEIQDFPNNAPPDSNG